MKPFSVLLDKGAKKMTFPDAALDLAKSLYALTTEQIGKDTIIEIMAEKIRQFEVKRRYEWASDYHPQ